MKMENLREGADLRMQGEAALNCDVLLSPFKGDGEGKDILDWDCLLHELKFYCVRRLLGDMSSNSRCAVS